MINRIRLWLVALLLGLRRDADHPSLETVWQPKLRCPTCDDRLEPMEAAPPETTGICPGCGELVRSYALAAPSPRGAACPGCATKLRTYLAVRVYTDAEADGSAHPEVLARLRGIQEQIRAAAICGCDNRGAITGPCKCAGDFSVEELGHGCCTCHGKTDVDVPTTPDVCNCFGCGGYPEGQGPGVHYTGPACLYSDEKLRADVGAGPCSGPVAIRDSWPDGYGGTSPVYGCEGHGEFMRELMG